MALNASGSNSLRPTLITEKLTPQITLNTMSARSVRRCGGLEAATRASTFTKCSFQLGDGQAAVDDLLYFR